MVDVNCDTPLHVAVMNGFYEGMVMLIDADANVGSEMDDGATPRFFAASDGWLEAVRVLLRAIANPLFLPAYGSHRLEIAVQNGHLKVVRELVQRSGIDSCACDGGALVLDAVTSDNHVDIVSFLCDAGVVDTEDVALCAAVEGCSETCVKLLLRTGWDRQQKYACLRQHDLRYSHAPRFARYLLEPRADTTSDARFPYDSDEGEEEDRGTPLELATSYSCRFSPNMRVHREFVGELKGVMRLLQQVEAVHAVSLPWPSDTGRPT
ncbi:unnamed protein product, partial [Pylaiella littoralis]